MPEMGWWMKDVLFFSVVLALCIEDVALDGLFRLDDLPFAAGAVAASLFMLALPGAVLGALVWYGTSAIRGKDHAPDVRWFVIVGIVARWALLRTA
jgi:hypothetical protein